MGFKNASNNFEGSHSISTKSLMNTRDVDGLVCFGLLKGPSCNL
jgi:hypothetical protein